MTQRPGLDDQFHVITDHHDIAVMRLFPTQRRIVVLPSVISFADDRS